MNILNMRISWFFLAFIVLLVEAANIKNENVAIVEKDCEFSVDYETLSQTLNKWSLFLNDVLPDSKDLLNDLPIFINHNIDKSVVENKLSDLKQKMVDVFKKQEEDEKTEVYETIKNTLQSIVDPENFTIFQPRLSRSMFEDVSKTIKKMYEDIAEKNIDDGIKKTITNYPDFQIKSNPNKFVLIVPLVIKYNREQSLVYLYIQEHGDGLYSNDIDDHVEKLFYFLYFICKNTNSKKVKNSDFFIDKLSKNIKKLRSLFIEILSKSALKTQEQEERESKCLQGFLEDKLKNKQLKVRSVKPVSFKYSTMKRTLCNACVAKMDSNIKVHFIIEEVKDQADTLFILIQLEDIKKANIISYILCIGPLGY